MTTIEEFTAFSRYLVLEDLGDFGIGGADPCSFDDACDRFSEAWEEARDCVVYRLDFADKKLVDVTADARQRVTTRRYQRDADLPDWMVS